MYQPGALDQNGIFNRNVIKEEKKTPKYHQAAYTYLLVGIIYLIIFYVTIPPHNFQALLEDYFNNNIPRVSNVLDGIDYSIIIKALATGAGISFVGLSYFIYKGFRTLAIILVVFYGIRLLGATLALFSEDVFLSVKYVLPLIAITFYMLARAAFDLKP
jgi:hypothetical protein